MRGLGAPTNPFQPSTEWKGKSAGSRTESGSGGGRWALLTIDTEGVRKAV
jgi:hypothetical protein